MPQRKKPSDQGARSKRSKKLSLLDLPPAVDPRGDLPTQPVILLRQRRATTLPPPLEPGGDEPGVFSLDNLARHSSFAPPVQESSSEARVSAPPPPPPQIASAPPPSAAPLVGLPQSTLSPPASPASTLPPPVVRTTPPSPPARGGLLLRTAGMIALSAGVGALVSSLSWGFRSGLEATREREAAPLVANRPPAASPASCAPAGTVAPPDETTALAHGSTPSAVRRGGPASLPVAETPRISVESLPLQSSLSTRALPVSLAEDPHERGARSRGASVESKAAERPHKARTPVRAERVVLPSLATAPSSTAIRSAIARAAGAARSCDGGPHKGRVGVTFSPSGGVKSVSLIQGFGDAAVNGCVLRAFGRAKVPAWSGDPIEVRKSVSW